MSKEWTDAERKAFGEKMKAAKLKKQTEQPAPEVETTIQNDDYNTLKQQVEELKQLIAQQAKPAPTQGAQITTTGLIGTLHKYNTDPSYYPDFTDRLAKEPRLSRFAFGENWELEFSVKTSAYTTLDNRRVDEPQFTIQLIGVIFDDDGNKTDGRYVRRQMIFFEDPDAALVVARENGLNVADFEEKAFLDEMRYLRVRDWLLENFYPPANTNKKQNKKQMVIGNQVVEYYEVSSVDNSAMPFNQLGNKIKG
jgi:post-segregation antitoxin (ccd killing protein)